MEEEIVDLLLALKLENDGLSKEGSKSAALGLEGGEVLLAMLDNT